MKTNKQRIAVILAFAAFAVFTIVGSFGTPLRPVFAQAAPTPTPSASAAGFDQNAALAKLRDQIKGREQESAPTVFKNIQTMKNVPAGRLLSIMEIGYARSLGVNCTHCHIPDKWESEEKPEKQIARDMSTMLTTINKDLLKNIKNLKDANAIVNCTTCHRGEVKPALNLPAPAKNQNK
jgi:hypothetical protein